MITSRKRADTLASILLLIGFAVLAFYNSWWPAVMLAIGLPTALKQFLTGHTYNAVKTLIVFVGVFITIQYDLSWKGFLPVIFILAALVLFLRAFSSRETEDEKEDDLNHEIDEEKK